MAKDPSKTEQATPRRIRKAREEGRVAKSQEVSKLINILAGFIILMFWLQPLARKLGEIFVYFLTVPSPEHSPELLEITPQIVYTLFTRIAWDLAYLLLPVILFIGLVVFISLRLQVGKLWTTKPFKFKWSKFNFIKGLQRMILSKQTVIRLVRSVIQAFVIGVAPFLLVKKEILSFTMLFNMDVYNTAVFMLDLGARLVKYALGPMAVIAAVDLWYTRWNYKEELKMTKNEIKEEHKQSEGDPMVKSRIRQKMQGLIGRKMLDSVPKADVVVTNPTHIAVALLYDPDEAPAPLVVAKGANLIAEKIKTIARENRVPVKENVPLARALYKQAEVGDTIPAELFQAVAVILAQIWKNNPAKQKRKKK